MAMMLTLVTTTMSTYVRIMIALTTIVAEGGSWGWYVRTHDDVEGWGWGAGEGGYRCS